MREMPRWNRGRHLTLGQKQQSKNVHRKVICILETKIDYQKSNPEVPDLENHQYYVQLKVKRVSRTLKAGSDVGV